ncbi:WGxxGxxG family protein [Mesorhizobium sp.]|uniref:WGxxGxxG family protein n=1 Tax=Mesorhizobium sp. TaxID=1871066 RepID=UPI000FE70335|nr:MAG: LPXTG cell wall anchor domain-containing protein [Mesorhizobium sp.]RWK71606.1 MAG: LPXTG cell wall anchor domain-containing protein [Mesorhizobium sp.]RWK82073.1 MAG: LPXTG cell wall anchor domain-containing protein [Mesorhizobium sp.]RWK83043.1 MAG: LPXTG cell wall anchor domain-containing protein [Mesorhizobium sp.]RWL09593.1 MAG: LPXTG cell wall anchor domain-containing protein [Mesorhizobium sp.]
MLTKSLLALMLATGLTATAAPAFSQETPTPTPPAAADDARDDFDWGWLGLIGLLGLAGLTGRRRRDDTLGRTNVR